MRYSLLPLLSFLSVFCFGQNEPLPINGVQDYRTGHYQFVGADIVVDPYTTIRDGVLEIKAGKIVRVGQGLTNNNGAVKVDLEGKTIYPAFIDLYADYGNPDAPKGKNKWWEGRQFATKAKSALGWNDAIKAQYHCHESFETDKDQAEAYRAGGFATVLSHRFDGIVRGTGSVIALTNNHARAAILKSNASANFSFNKGSSSLDYPGSLMGAIALLKQTYYDGKWYAANKGKVDVNLSLDAFNQQKNLLSVFTAKDLLDVLRADKVGDEFGIQYLFKTDGTCYQKLDAIKATNGRLIVPLNFPDALDVTDPYLANYADYKDLKHWEMAPANASMLAQAEIPFVFTADGLEKPSDIFDQLRIVKQHQLSAQQILAALTTEPASILGMSNELGKLQRGGIANFFITDGDIFEEGTTLYQTWVQGEQYVINDFDFLDVRGDYTLTVNQDQYELIVDGAANKPNFSLKQDTNDIKIEVTRNDRLVQMNFTAKDADGLTRLSGRISEDFKTWMGKGQNEKGAWVDFTVQLDTAFNETTKDATQFEAPSYSKVTYPFQAYGNENLPTSKSVLIKGATVWTNESDGKLENTDVLIKNGKIAQVGKNISAGGTEVVDGTNKHVTAGIIDEHSHIAISRGVNEWTQSSSAEVSIADVVNSEDVNIYRQLSGGVTSAQLLHGSANPIGGQSAVIKMRWGKTPEQMKFENMPKFIKFALGENVKGANWPAFGDPRFPQTRMGVEQVYEDYFTRAKAYMEAKKTGKNPDGTVLRKDLELETLAEILNSERFISCHSYVQSEINMLMKVAEKFGFRINTFTHILEGYKVAEQMKEHGVNASTFSDWWAYKYEVIDAIPYNASILTEMGINTSINSDDAEMGRRLNQEAAKSVKYGGMSEVEALKMVTLNPAKMLHIDDRVGSIKVGKDADLVLWTDHPLSMYAKAQQTYVDGVRYFDLDEDLAKRETIKEERNRIIQKMIAFKADGGYVKPIEKESKEYFNCVSGTTLNCGHVR